MPDGLVKQAYFVRQYRTNWWAAWPGPGIQAEVEQLGHVIFLSYTRQVVIERLCDFYGLVPNLGNNFAA